MAPYELRFKQTVAKDLKGIDRVHLAALFERMSALADDPRPVGLEKLSGLDRYRVRHGPYRIVYEIRDRTLIVVVVKLGHRRDVYR